MRLVQHVSYPLFSILLTTVLAGNAFSDEGLKPVIDFNANELRRDILRSILAEKMIAIRSEKNIASEEETKPNDCKIILPDKYFQTQIPLKTVGTMAAENHFVCDDIEVTDPTNYQKKISVAKDMRV